MSAQHTPGPRLIRTAKAKTWVNNSVSRQPASWQVEGTNVHLRGCAGCDAPYYDLIVGGEVVERRIRSFRHARRAAIAKATGGIA